MLRACTLPQNYLDRECVKVSFCVGRFVGVTNTVKAAESNNHEALWYIGKNLNRFAHFFTMKNSNL